MSEEAGQSGGAATATQTALAGAGGGESAAAAQQAQGSAGGEYTPPPLIGEDNAFAPDWISRLGEDVAPFSKTLEKFTGPASLAKSYGELERMKGNPGADPAAPDAATFRKFAGVPEDYRTEPPEGRTINAPTLDSFKEVIQKHNGVVTQECWNDLTANFLAQSDAAQQAMEAQQELALQEGIANLQKEWGHDYDTKLENAQRVARTLGLDVEAPEVGNNLTLIKALAGMSDKLSEGTIQGVGSGSMVNGTSGNKAEADRIMNDPTHPLHAAMHDTGHAQHREANAQYDRLMRAHDRALGR